MKKNLLTFCFLGGLLIVFFAAGFSVTKSQAVVPLGFGGQLVAWEYCPCSASLWLEYAPIPDSSFPGGPLSYSSYDTITYPYYNMTTIGVWHLGTYAPGVQGCLVYDGADCHEEPVWGHEVMVGTSDVPSSGN